MPKYEFLVSNGVPMPANKAVRSHAIKTALQLCSNRVAGGDLRDGAADSARTAQRKKELKGQFKIRTAPIKSRGSKPKRTSQTMSRHDSSSMSIPANANQRGFCSNYTTGVERFSAIILDPFGTIPISSNPRIDTLLKHCMHSSFLLPVALAHRLQPWCFLTT
jgi:hypothetical protein